MFAAFVVATVPWLPSQAITNAETGAFTGYVLQVSDGYTTILAIEPRRIIRLDTAGTVQELCTAPRDVFTQPSVLQLLPVFKTSVEYPSCPTAIPRIPPAGT